MPAGAPPGAPEGFLVAPFENESPVKALDWMASALAVTTADVLESLPRLRPAYGPGVIEGWPGVLDTERAIEKMREARATWLVTGAFSRPNWRAGVTVKLYRLVEKGGAAELVAVAKASRDGEREKLFEVLSGAIEEVLKAQPGWMPEDPQRLADVRAALKRLPTKDIYAYTLFGRGLNFFFGLDPTGTEEQAEKLLSRTTFIDPKFAEARRFLALVHAARGEPNKAAGQYAYALELKPGYYPAMASLALLYRDSGKKQPARELAEKALALRGWDVDMRLLLGTLELEAGELSAALANLLQVTKLRPRKVEARRALCQVYSARGDIAELSDELARLAELLPDDLDVRLELGAAWTRLGRFDKAIAVYEDVLGKQPKHLQALKFTGDVYRRMGEPDKAIEVYERARKLSPDDPRAYFLLGAAYAEAGNDQKAMAVLQEAQQFKSYVGEAWIDLGAIALRRGDLDRATWYLQRAVLRAPTRPRAHYNYALLLEATKQREKALQSLKLAAELDPEDAETRYLSGVLYLRMGRLVEAKGEFAHALKIKPDHGDAKHNLGLLEDLDRRYGAEHSGAGAQ